MSILNVGEIHGSTENNREIMMESSNNLVITGTLAHDRLGRFTLPVGTTAERPSSPTAGPNHLVKQNIKCMLTILVMVEVGS